MLIHPQVVSKGIDPFREHRYLDFGRSCITRMAGVLRNYRRFRFFIHTHDVCYLQKIFLIFLQVSIPAVSQLKPPAGLVSGQNYTKELWKPTGDLDSAPELSDSGMSLSTLSQSGAERSPGVCRKKIEAVAG